MTNEHQSNGKVQPDGASESKHASGPPRTLPISSGPFEISPASFVPASSNGPPPSKIEAVGRRAQMSLSVIVAIACGVLVVLVGLTLLLLFR